MCRGPQGSGPPDPSAATSSPCSVDLEFPALIPPGGLTPWSLSKMRLDILLQTSLLESESSLKPACGFLAV